MKDQCLLMLRHSMLGQIDLPGWSGYKSSVHCMSLYPNSPKKKFKPVQQSRRPFFVSFPLIIADSSNIGPIYHFDSKIKVTFTFLKAFFQLIFHEILN